MNVLFIYSLDDILSPAKPLQNPGQMQFGISYISSFLKAHGHDTKLIVLSRMLGKKNTRMVDEYIRRASPKLICFTAVSTEYRFIANIAKYIKSRYPEIFLIIGGPHASLNAEETVREEFDAICIGEGEYSVLELVSQLEKNIYPSGIHNLWIKQGPEIGKNPSRPFLEDLDSLPFPDREMWEEWTEEGAGPEYPVLLGRGCPFQCTYCCNHALRKLAEGPYVRFRSTDNIVKEIEGIAGRHSTKINIYLEVETIGADKEWAMDLCSKLERINAARNQPILYRTNLRLAPNLDLDPLFAAFKRSNFWCINIGVESGSERVRRHILKRNYSNQEIVDAVGLARKHGLKIYFYNMIGIPGETEEDFKETIKINRICLPDKIFNHIFFPYPGTELYNLCKTEGLLPKVINTELERCQAVLDLPGFTKKRIQKNFVWFDYNVYKGHRPLSKILNKVLVSKFRSNSHLHYLYRRLTYFRFFKWLKKILKPD